jgi:stromal membrane-associated protein
MTLIMASSTNTATFAYSVEDEAALRKERLLVVQARPENQTCCDCSDKNPTWATIIVLPQENAMYQQKGLTKIGGFCCFQCSGAHRSLGTHICFVRSVNLDSCKSKQGMAWGCTKHTQVHVPFDDLYVFI